MRLSKHGLKRFPEYLEYLNAVTAHDSSLMESSLKRTLERVRAEGTAEELHSSLRTLFQFYCREGNRDEAVAIISELEVNASNEVSVLIEMLFEELGDAVLAEEYVDRYLVVGGWGCESLIRRISGRALEHLPRKPASRSAGA